MGSESQYRNCAAIGIHDTHNRSLMLYNSLAQSNVFKQGHDGSAYSRNRTDFDQESQNTLYSNYSSQMNDLDLGGSDILNRNRQG